MSKPDDPRHCWLRLRRHRWRTWGAQAPSGWPSHVVCIRCGRDRLRYLEDPNSERMPHA